MSESTYATLSHCWGSHRPMITTRNNLSVFSHRIPAGLLPRTFREALDIVRELGIRYIWIDSLCIIQDDLDDWTREAARMQDVYAGSSVTISASDARDSTQGCFVDDNSDVIKRSRHRVSQLTISDFSDKSSILVRIHNGDVRDCADTSLLSHRGWSLQERLLSRRVVHCMRPEIHWNCRCSYHVESHASFSVKRFEIFSANFVPDEATAEQLHQLWCRWMQCYSWKKVTVQKDRLSALAGLVKHYAQRTGHQHVLACWQETIVTDLLWLRSDNPIDSSIAPLKIPSWSWLFRAGEIRLDLWARVGGGTGKFADHVEDHTELIEASVTWAGSPMVSDLLTAKLVIEGPIKQMKLRIDPRARKFHPPYMNVGDEEPDFNLNPIPWRCAGQFDLEKEREDDLFICLLMRSVTWSGEDRTYNVQETFLILLPDPNGDGDTYQRIGIAMFRGKEATFGPAERRRIQLV